MIGEGDATVVLSLAGAIVTLVGTFVWAVKFFANKLFGRDGQNGAIGRLTGTLSGMRGDLRENTSTMREVREMQKQTHRVLQEIASQEQQAEVP